MAIDESAWYRRLHLMHAMDTNEQLAKFGLPPLEGPQYRGHGDKCEECNTARIKNQQSKVWVKEHANDPNQKTYRDIPSNLNHGNECPDCNQAVLSEMTRNGHFDVGGNEGRG